MASLKRPFLEAPRSIGAARCVVLLGALLGVLGCSKPVPTGTPLILGVSTLRISLPVFVALERGLFTARGLDVEVRRFDTAQPLADELAAGRIDAGGYVALPILFGRGADAPKVRVFTALVEDAEHPLSFLLVKKGSGLRGAAALKGSRIGILPTLAYRRWLEAILLDAGLQLTDVTVLPIAPPLQVDALATGGVDALFTGDPMATAALARGVAEPGSNTPDVPRVLGSPFLFGTFAVTSALATKQPAAAAALRAALDEAIDLLRHTPALGREAITPFLREGERPFAARYPEARYLRSDELQPEQLERALGQLGGGLHAAQLALP